LISGVIYRVALACATTGFAWAAVLTARADTTLATSDLQLNFITSASSFGLQVIDRTNNAVLLTQSSLAFNGVAVTGVSSTSNNGSIVSLGLALSGGGTATATYSVINSDRIQIALTGPTNSAPAVTQSFADQGDRYYGTWMNTYTNVNTGQPINLNNRGASHFYHSRIEQAGESNSEGSRASFYFTNKNVGLYVESFSPANITTSTTNDGTFDFTAGHSFTFNGNVNTAAAMTYDILRAGSPKGVMQAAKAIGGGAFVPPLWALESFWWRDDARNAQSQNPSVKGQALILDDAQKLQTNHIIAGSITIDRPYGSTTNDPRGTAGSIYGWGNYDFDPAYYSNPTQMIQSLRNTYGLNTQVWVTNRLNNDQLTQAQIPSNNVQYFHTGGQSSQTYPAVDLRDPTSYNWFKFFSFTNSQNQTENLGLSVFANMGIMGFKIDRGGEQEFPDNVTNIETPLVAKLGAEALQAVVGSQYFEYWRNANDAARKYTALWNGDSSQSFAGLATSVTDGIRAGLTEFSIYGSDTGGYRKHLSTDGVTEELFDRWIGYSAYTPLMDVLIGPGRTPWYDWSSQSVTIAAKQTQVHHDLIPYVRSLLAFANNTGVPAIRAMFLEFPNDPNPAIADMSDQYMYGPNMLVAPVIQSGVTSRSVYLPAGIRWVNYNDKTTVYSGGQTITVNAPLDTVPIFVRAGAVFPHGDINKANQTTPNWAPSLNIDIFPSQTTPASSFDYYTDGGTASTIVAAFIAQNKFEVSFTDLGVNGTLDLYLGRFFQFNGISSAQLNGSFLSPGSGYTFDAIQNLLMIPFAGPSDAIVTFAAGPPAIVQAADAADTLVPEPSAMVLAGIGMLGLSLVFRRRASNDQQPSSNC
jgi:alpha-D-xyloside xylohydrolase